MSGTDFECCAKKSAKMASNQNHPDAEIHPVATGLAADIVKKHENTGDELTLYSGWFCPFVQRAWITLEEKNIPYNYKVGTHSKTLHQTMASTMWESKSLITKSGDQPISQRTRVLKAEPTRTCADAGMPTEEWWHCTTHREVS